MGPGARARGVQNHRGMRRKSLWILLNLLTVLAALLAGSAHATKPIAPLPQMVPNEDLRPSQTMTCGQLLRRVRMQYPDTLESLNNTLVSDMINFLLENRFHVTAGSLSVEQVTVRNILARKFEKPPSGNILYEYIKNSGKSVAQWVAETPEGKKLSVERNDADYKRWSLDVLIKVAKDLESLGLPFEREFLKSNSSLVGMKLAEIYGYPVLGSQILFRMENKLEFTIEEIRWMAGLPETSPHLKTVEQYLALEWTPDLVIKIARFLMEEKGYHLSFNELHDDRDVIQDVVLEKYKILITVSLMDEYVQQFFGGWRPLKENHLGITYRGREKHHAGRPDWSKRFIKDVLKFIHNQGYEPRAKLLYDKELFAPIQEKIESEFGYRIRGKTLYEKAAWRFESFEAACQAADVPYFEYSEQHLSTIFIEDKPEFGVEEINPVVLVEVLQFIDALGFEPVRPFLESPAYDLVKERVDEAFGMDITGAQLMAASRKYFRHHSATLKAADVAYYSHDMEDFVEEEPPAELVEALKLVIEHIPEISGISMRHQHSNDVEQLLKEKMNFKISGHNLSLWARAWGNELWLRKEMTGYRGYFRMLQFLKSKEVFPNLNIKAASSEDSEEEEFLSREVVLQISKILNAAGIFPSRSNLTNPDNREKIIEVITANFGGSPSVRQIFLSGSHHFGTFDGVRKALNLPYHPPGPEYSEGDILEMLEVVWDRYPGIGAQAIRVKHSTAIGRLLKRKLGVNLAGVGLLKLVENEFGDLTSGFQATKVDMKWYLAHGPQEDFFLEVIAYLIEQGFPVTQDNLNLKEKFSPARKMLQKQFKITLWGSSIWNYSKIFYERRGALETARQKAWDLVQARKKHPFLRKNQLTKIVNLFNDNGLFPSWANLAVPENRKRAEELLKQEFGDTVNFERIFVSSFHHFGNFDQVRAAVGLPWVEPAKVEDGEILHILRLVWNKWPAITPSDIRKGYGAKITELILEDNPESTVTAKSLDRMVQERYGGFLEGFEAAGIDVPWTVAYPPSEDMVIDVVAFLMEKGFTISSDNLAYKNRFAEAHGWIKKEFGWDIWGSAIRNQIYKYFGSRGGLEVVKARARQRLEERKKKSKK